MHQNNRVYSSSYANHHLNKLGKCSNGLGEGGLCSHFHCKWTIIINHTVIPVEHFAPLVWQPLDSMAMLVISTTEVLYWPRFFSEDG